MMSNSLKSMLLCLAAAALMGGSWCIDSRTGETKSPTMAARYHARNRTASFFQRAGTQGQRSSLIGHRS